MGPFTPVGLDCMPVELEHCDGLKLAADGAGRNNSGFGHQVHVSIEGRCFGVTAPGISAVHRALHRTGGSSAGAE